MFIKKTLCFMGALLLTPAAHAALSLDDAMRLAQTRQPLLESQQAMVEAARQNAVFESHLPDPKATLGLQNVPTDNFSLTQESMTQAMVGISQVIPTGNKLALRGQRGRAIADQNAYELENGRRMVRRDAGVAWLAVFYPARARTLVQDLEKEAERQVEAARIRYRTNALAQQDVLAAENTRDLLRDREAEFALKATDARADLMRWIGDAAQQDLSPTLPVLPPPPRLQALTARLAQHPSIRGYDRAIAAARADVDLARAAYKPDIEAGVSYGVRGAGRSNMISGQVSFDLPVRQDVRQDRELAAKWALFYKARDDRANQLRILGAELHRAWSQWQSYQSRARWFETRILPQTRARTRAALIGYQTGKADLSAVLNARTAEVEARLQLLEIQTNAERAYLQLTYFE